MPTIRVDTGTRQTTTRIATEGIQGPSGSGAEATSTVLGVLKLTGDLSGTAASPTVAKVRGRTVASTAPADGEGLVWNDGASQWEPGDISVVDATVVTKGKITTVGAQGIDDRRWSARAYGATGVLADDQTEAVIDALNSAQALDGTQVLRLPAASDASASAGATYTITEPLRLTRDGFALEGDAAYQRTTLRTTYEGPAVVIGPVVGTDSLVTQLVPPANGMPAKQAWVLDNADGAARTHLCLDDIVRGRCHGASELRIEFFLKLTDDVTGSDIFGIFSSSGYLTDAGGETDAGSAFQFRVSGSGSLGEDRQLAAVITTVGSGAVTLVDPDPMDLDTIYHVALTYDGITARLFRTPLNDALMNLVDDAAATGAIVQRWFETVCVGPTAGVFGDFIFDAAPATIDAIRLNFTQAFYTAHNTHTTPTTGWATGAPGMAGVDVCINFDGLAGEGDIIMAYCDNGGPTTAWIPIRAGNVGSTSANGITVRNLSFTAATARGGGFIWANLTTRMLIENVTSTGAYATFLRNNCFLSRVRNVKATGDSTCKYVMCDDGAGNENHYTDCHVAGGDVGMWINQAQPVKLDRCYVVAWRAGYGAFINGSAARLSSVTISPESRTTECMGGLHIAGNLCSVSASNLIVGASWNDGSPDAVPPIVVSGGDAHDIDTVIMDAAGIAAEYVTVRFAPTVPMRVSSYRRDDDSIPLSLSPEWVVAGGSDRAEQSGGYQSWISYDAAIGGSFLYGTEVLYKQAALAAETAATYDLRDDTLSRAKANVEIRSATNWARWELSVSYNRDGGGAPTIGAAVAGTTAVDGSNGPGGAPVSWAATFDVSTNTLRLRTTAAADAIVTGDLTVKETREP